MGRHLFIVRHGERTDYVFGKQWITQCINGNGEYSRYDLNQPKTLPKRNDWSEYVIDAPLTVIGNCQATITGDALNDARVSFSRVYASPAFRCVETATNVLKAMSLNENVSINVEPGLFEWLGPVYSEAVPKWMSPSQLKDAGFNVNVDYIPETSVERLLLCKDETCEQWYNRSFALTKAILRSVPENENILFVAHGGSMDPLTRQLTGKEPKTDGDLAELTPLCGILCVQINENGCNQIVEPPIFGLKHGSNHLYEWQKLVELE